MTMRFFILLGGALVLLPLLTVTACGPDFEPDVFVRMLQPDLPVEFATGKLGMLWPTYKRADLIVAYRYLNGGELSEAERAAYEPTYSMEVRWSREENQWKSRESAIKAWNSLRSRFYGSAKEIPANRTVEVRMPGWTYQTSYLNCPEDAFRTTLLTFNQRANAWGEHSPDLVDWMKGQDAVFANCGGGDPVLPAAAPDNSSALLKADRAYQLAAAYFYSGDLDEARKRFEAIRSDSASPWHGLAGYLAARSLVRQAFLSAPENSGTVAAFDPGLMKQAADLLNSLLEENNPQMPRQAIEKELNLVRLRVEPVARMRELSKALAAPVSDPAFEQHLKDLTWFLDNHAFGIREDTDDWQLISQEQRDSHLVALAESQKAAAFSRTFGDVREIRASHQLVDWLLTFQSPAVEAQKHAISKWQKTQSLPWLVAAITKSTSNHAAAVALVTAAAQVKADSPAWETVTYHRARLLIALGRSEEARKLLDSVLPAIQASKHESSANAYASLRMRAATDLDDFLTYGPQKVLSATSEARSSLDECLTVMTNPKRKYDCVKDVAPTQFSSEAADFFNTEAPITVLIAAAHSSQLSPQLRQSVAMMAWVRSVLLKDDDSAAKLLPLLPAKLQEQAGSGTGFRPLMTLVRNPGLSPYLEPGIQRNYSYDFVESFADNWWCSAWKAAYEGGPALGREPVPFLVPRQRKEGKQQVQQLLAQGSAQLHLGGLVLQYAKDNPHDPNVPESLYLMMRMVRYGCRTWDNTPRGKEENEKQRALVKEAARLLRQRYVSSPWTEKARPLGV